jgi:hypothetical protein
MAYFRLKLPTLQYFGAKGVISRRAWGNAPGFQLYHPTSAESATQRMADETRFQR